MYDGTWKDGKQHGIGTFTDQKGEKRRGEWEMGERTRWFE
jgi:hypothetical protein